MHAARKLIKLIKWLQVFDSRYPACAGDKESSNVDVKCESAVALRTHVLVIGVAVSRSSKLMLNHPCLHNAQCTFSRFTTIQYCGYATS